MLTNLLPKNSVYMRQKLLTWYDRHKRVMPWRTIKNSKKVPYKIWLSEIMLQQTTVTTVGPYFQHFLKTWPTIDELANASLDDVLKVWQGLGYYSRARNLHKCAKLICNNFDGRFPNTEEQLEQLPGIGPYTAAAILAIAFDKPAIVVDGNVERVITRVFGIFKPLPEARPIIKDCAAKLAPKTTRGRPGDYAQAVMDLGATVCRPRKPLCDLCPWEKYCIAKQQNFVDQVPRKAPKKLKAVRKGVVFLALMSDGSLFLRRRPENGLLGGMMEFPSTVWLERSLSLKEICEAAPFKTQWVKITGTVNQAFSHFQLQLQVRVAVVNDQTQIFGGIWVDRDRLDEFALPNLMKKVWAFASKRIQLLPRLDC